MIHESAHQPLVGKAPGLTLGPFGQWFNRNETWAEQAGPWVNYIARSSYLLQQGHFGADLIYFYGEDSNLTAIFADKSPDVPAGYGFDYINADALIHELSVADGRITTKSGMSYRVLGLDPYSKHMSLPVLRAIHKLVEDGAVVAGPKPTDDPSLADDQAEFRKLNDELFGDGTGVHRSAKARSTRARTLADVFSALNVAPDFDYTKPESDTRLLFVHRKLADGDLYFVDNRNDRDESVDATFRVTGKAPELWHAETGKSEPVSYTIADGRTTVPLASGAVGHGVRGIPQADQGNLAHAAQSDGNATGDARRPVERELPAGPRCAGFHHSGQALVVERQHRRGREVLLRNRHLHEDHPGSAGLVQEGRASVDRPGRREEPRRSTVNGKPLGIVWHAPYRVDATSALKPVPMK